MRKWIIDNWMGFAIVLGGWLVFEILYLLNL